MNKPFVALQNKLSYGKLDIKKDYDSPKTIVGTLARAYEKARNALEFRADNLVRRAAIERILKRRVIINKNYKSISDHLLTELSWAKYISPSEIELAKKQNIEKTIKKYMDFLGSKVPVDWIVKIASAEIEEIINLNIDYKQFTYFTFQVVRQKININDDNIDLLIYFATDKVYAESDDEQVAYHIVNLAGNNPSVEKFEEAWKLFNIAKGHKEIPKLMKFVRRQMPPMILLRDIYFYDPQNFNKNVKNQETFFETAREVLDIQLSQMSSKINTAGFRSVVYVFLTKMILAFGLEVPLELFFYGSINKLPLAINLLFPPLIMWLTTMQIHLPKQKEQEKLIERTYFVLDNFEKLTEEPDNLNSVDPETKQSLTYSIFSVVYIIFFIGIFGLIYWILDAIGYTLFSKMIFVFFLTIIAFFAYRIAQITKVYSWGGDRSSNLIGIIAIPILSIGSRLSKQLGKLNFLAFAFDFILEAPFKIILGVVDDWLQFMSIKKDEEIVE